MGPRFREDDVERLREYLASRHCEEPTGRANARREGGRGAICPTGKSVTCLSSPFRKNIPLLILPKSNLYPSPSRPTEGRLAIVTDAGRDAVDAGGVADERR